MATPDGSKTKRTKVWIPPQDRRCKMAKKNGDMCTSLALKGKDFCFFHNPDKTDLHLAQVKGAEAQRTRKIPNELAEMAKGLRSALEVRNFLAEIIGAATQGKLAPPMVNAMAGAARMILEAQKVASQLEPDIITKSDFELMMECIRMLQENGQTDVLDAIRAELAQ